MNGSDIAFERLYSQIHKEIYFLIYKIVLDQSLAEDLVQDTFVTVWQKRHLIDQEKPIKNWVITIGIRLAQSALRKRMLLGKYLWKVKDIFTSNVSTLDEGGLANDLLKELPDGQRMVIVLIDLEGYSYEETAKLLCLNIGTIRSRLNRARQNLKAKYELAFKSKM